VVLNIHVFSRDGARLCVVVNKTGYGCEMWFVFSGTESRQPSVISVVQWCSVVVVTSLYSIVF